MISFGVVMGWMALLVAMLVLTGCNKELRMSMGYDANVKAHVRIDTATRTADTLQQTTHASKEGIVSLTETEEHEAVPGGKAELELEQTDLQPVTDARGRQTGRTYVQRNGRAELRVAVDKKGKTTITCKADSLEREVKRYRKDSIWSSQAKDSMAMRIAVLETSHTTADSSKVVVKQAQVWQKSHTRGGWLVFWLVVIVTVGVYLREKLC